MKTPSRILLNRLEGAKSASSRFADKGLQIMYWNMVSRQALAEDNVEIWEEAENNIKLLKGRH